MRILAVFLTALLAPAGAFAQTISGTVVDIMGTPIQGVEVAYNLAGNVQRDTTDAAGAYLLAFGTSSVPEDGGPVVQNTTWGKLKAGFRDVPAAYGKAALPRTDISPDTLYFDGGNDHWSVIHNVGQLTEPLTYNIAVAPQVWTIEPYFVNTPVVAADVQTPLAVQTSPGYPPFAHVENVSWPMIAFPIPIDGDFDSPADVDSLNARIAHFTQMTGRDLFRYAPGEVEFGGEWGVHNGIWWQHNSFQNSTNFYYPDPDNPIENTGWGALVKTTHSGYLSRTTSEHEMVRALGVLGNANNPLGGITNVPASHFNSYDTMIIEWIMQDRARTEAGQNHARLSEMR